MPVVNEHQIASIDLNRPGPSRSDGQLNNRYSCKSFKSASSRKSEILSPELIWQVSDIFLCLESLGATVNKDSAPYDRLNYAENSFDRVRIGKKHRIYIDQVFNYSFFSYLNQPSSEISIDAADGAYGNTPALMNSSVSSASNTKFHRSMSMGQGWQQSLANRFSYQADENCENKVVMRRKNINTFDYGKDLHLKLGKKCFFDVLLIS